MINTTKLCQTVHNQTTFNNSLAGMCKLFNRISHAMLIQLGITGDIYSFHLHNGNNFQSA